MITGRQALAQIEQTIGSARKQEAQFERDFAAATQEVGRLRIQRTEAFRELARMKLDTITQHKVVSTLDAAERQALALLNERQEALRHLTERRREAEEGVQVAGVARQAAVDALEEALARVDDLRKRVEAQASVDPSWTAARARVDELTGHARQALKKASDAAADRDEKRRPYEADPLFMYLWNRRFGTATYTARGFVRAMDRLVARVVGFDKAGANYTLLNQIPERLGEHAKRMAEELKAAQDALTALERTALVNAGMEAVEAAATKAREDVGQAEARLADARDNLSTLDRTYDASILEGDAPYHDAVEVLAAADQKEKLDQLYEEALRTPSPRDEEVVRRIQATDATMNQALRRAVEAHRRMKETAVRRVAIERQWRELRQQGYDTPYGTVRNEAALGNVLGSVLTGAIGGAILGQVLRGGFHQGPSPWDSGFGGGISIPPPDGFATGGAFGSGDGFRTGGSF
ncbi:coiled-coil domain-containing protein [Alsobacter sp. SYSU BS001988]